MTSSYSHEELIALLKRSLQTIQELKERKNTQVNEPIAIVGMACRFPCGCDTPEKFWDFLLACKDAASEIPANRFDVNDFYDPNSEKAGKMYTKYGSFLQEELSQFDAQFFGISPREANELDPQQRLLLELSWEALERSGYNPLSLQNSKSGLFIGLISSEYGLDGRTTQEISPYTLTGILPNLASGRLAHFFGFQGPAITVDTACSSSLVSTHLACESLGNHDCDLALAGGVSLMISPQAFIMLSKVHALSPDGHCKAFDAAADGYGRGEGGGLVVLKRLSDALRDKDKILAVIEATSVNQDGPSSGLTVPNGLAQQTLIQDTLAKAKLKAKDISYIEAHGTGTPLGDPIEIQALTAIFGKEKRASPLHIGTVKTNIGHLEAAAGIAALIKTVLCLQNNYIPAHRYVQNISPRINLNAIPAILAKEAQFWEPSDKARHAGISSFGFSGTNAHCIISDAPRQQIPLNKTAENNPQILTLSAESETALKELIKRYQSYVETTESCHLPNLCANANCSRHSFSQRVAYLANNTQQLQKLLAEDLQSNQSGSSAAPTPASRSAQPPTSRATPPPTSRDLFAGSSAETGVRLRGQAAESRAAEMEIAFLFNAKISDNYRQTLNFYQTHSKFQVAWSACADILTAKFGQNPLVDSNIQQPYHVFAFDYALAQLWLNWGLKPSIVLGSGAGVYVAACIAGVMSLETALHTLLQEMQGKSIPDGKDLLPPELSMIDNNTGEWLKKSACLDPATWSGALNQQANFSTCFKALQNRNVSWILNLGSSESIDAENLIAMPTNEEETNRILAELWCSGARINWQAIYADSHFEKLILPTYPFQRKSYWLTKPEKNSPEQPLSKQPFTAELISSPLAEKLLRFTISPDNLPTLADTYNLLHVGYFVEMLKNSVEQIFHTNNYILELLSFHAPLVAFADKPTLVWLVFKTITEQDCDFEFLTEDKASNTFRSHVSGRLRLQQAPTIPGIKSLQIENLKKQSSCQLDSTAFYAGIEQRGAKLGESVQWIRHTWSVSFATLAQFSPLPNSQIPPGVWDACAQLFHAAIVEEAPRDKLYMVNEWNNFYYYPNVPVESPLWCHFLVDKEDNASRLQGSFILYSAKGQVLAKCERFTMIALQASMLKAELQPAVAGQQTEFLSQLKKANDNERLKLLSHYLSEKFSTLLKMDTKDFDLDLPLIRYGIDSIIGLECNSTIFADLGVRLPAEAFVENTSINLLAQKLAAELSKLLQSEPGEIVQSSNKQTLSRWFAANTLSPETKMKLFCFPYGGGGATLYKDWQKQMPTDLTVIPIQLPGRENRFEEQPIDHIAEMTDKLVEAFSTMPPGPCAFYGHSAGALVAWRLALRLCQDKQYKEMIKHLFVAGYSAPCIMPNPWATLFAQRLKAHGFEDIPGFAQLQQCPPNRLQLFTEAAEFKINILQFAESNEDLEFIRLLIAKLLCDMKVVTSFTFAPDETLLDIPITAFAGELDDRCPLESIRAWQALTSGQFKSHTLPGDHFFLHRDQSQRAIINLILSELAGGKL